ncbi:hypothetical protein PENTCL1PPCAC_5213, partial [Pristionchus entomophagus]
FAMETLLSAARNITDMRYLFYLVLPSELGGFETPDAVPPYIELGSPWMMLLIILEMFTDIDRYRLDDTVTSICAGLC